MVQSSPYGAAAELLAQAFKGFAGLRPPEGGAAQITSELLNSMNPAVQMGPSGRLEAKAPETPYESQLLNSLHNAGKLLGAATTAPASLDAPALAITKALGGVPKPSEGFGTLGGVLSDAPGHLQFLPDFFKEMQRGVPDEELLRKYGWFLDKDLQPKFEYSDVESAFTPKGEDIFGDLANIGNMVTPRPVGSYEEIFSHPEFSQYNPDLAKQIQIWIDPVPDPYLHGSYANSAHGPQIWLNQSLLHQKSLEDLRSTLLHEGQHATAAKHEKAGWASGGNPKKIRYDISAAQLKHVLPTQHPLTVEIRKALTSHAGTDLSMPLTEFNDAAYRTDFNAPWELYTTFKQLPPQLQTAFEPLVKDHLKTLEEFFKQPASRYSFDDAFNIYQAILDEANARTVQLSRNLDQDILDTIPFHARRSNLIPHDEIIPSFDANKTWRENQLSKPLRQAYVGKPE